MRIEEYLETLPGNLLSGEDVQLPEKTLGEIFKFAGLCKDDIFYHLGCGDEKGVMSACRLGVKRAVGIDINPEKIRRARDSLKGRGEFVCKDVTESDISDATVILFWFADEKIIERMLEKFAGLKHGTRIITIWGPLPGCIPDEVEFPYILNRVPFRRTDNLREQLLAVFGVKCVDFVTAWEFAERYTKSVGAGVKNDRFLTIIQTLTIWINAKRLGVACGKGMPKPIKTYIGIMKTQFGIDFSHLLE